MIKFKLYFFDIMIPSLRAYQMNLWLLQFDAIPTLIWVALVYFISQGKNMNFKDTLKKAMTKVKAFAAMPAVKAVALLVAVVAIPQIAHAATATDLFSGQQATVSKTFGEGSSVTKWFYIGEVFLGLATYMKTRNPLVFVGIAMVMIFTKVAFGIIG